MAQEICETGDTRTTPGATQYERGQRYWEEGCKSNLHHNRERSFAFSFPRRLKPCR